METIFTKEFNEISLQEREEMKDLFTNEEEFNRLKKLLLSLESETLGDSKQAIPSPQLKQRLDAVFQEKYPVKKTVFLLDRNKFWCQQNLFKLAALFVLLLSFITFWNMSLKKDSVQTAEHQKNVKKEVESVAAEEKKAMENTTSGTIEKTKSPKDAKPKVQLARAEDFKALEADDEIRFDTSESKEETTLSPSVTGSGHPDGIYEDKDLAKPSAEMMSREVNAKNFALKSNQKLLDLLTTAY